LLRLPRLLLSLHLRCLPRMCCCLLLVMCMLLPPLLLSMQIGYNGLLERRQSDRRNRHSGDYKSPNKRNRNEKLDKNII
jgi:hypothetical protein